MLLIQNNPFIFIMVLAGAVIGLGEWSYALLSGKYKFFLQSRIAVWSYWMSLIALFLLVGQFFAAIYAADFSGAFGALIGGFFSAAGPILSFSD